MLIARIGQKPHLHVSCKLSLTNGPTREMGFEEENSQAQLLKLSNPAHPIRLIQDSQTKSTSPAQLA